MTEPIRATIREANLQDAADEQSLIEIIDSYARGAGGQSAPISDEARANMAKGLREHSSAMVLFACAAGQPVGVAVCVFGFSTFAGRPSLNVHDLAVLPDHQGRGHGAALLGAAEERARERGCAKLTLEVHDTNEGAKRLYRRVGFGPWDVPTLFVSKPL